MTQDAACGSLTGGRNALFPTEAVYHVLVIGCWLAELNNRPRRANLFLLLLATTHPWSGLELLLTMNLWRGIQFLRMRNRQAIGQLSLSAVILIVFLGYYMVWLPTFPSHAKLQNVWELNWRVSWTSAALAYAPVLIPAVVVIRRRIQSGTLTDMDCFLMCALAVAAGLAFHDRFINPVQPIHFTRGYVWMPLFLLGLPFIMEWFRRLGERSAAIAVIAVVLAVADNAVFSLVHAGRQWKQADGFHMDRHERAVLRALHTDELTQGRVILSESENLNYLLPAYANVRPWLGHQFNTPSFPQRRMDWEACFAAGTVVAAAIPEGVTLLLIRTSRDTSALKSSREWTVLPQRNSEWQIWVRGTATRR